MRIKDSSFWSMILTKTIEMKSRVKIPHLGNLLTQVDSTTCLVNPSQTKGSLLILMSSCKWSMFRSRKGNRHSADSRILNSKIGFTYKIWRTNKRTLIKLIMVVLIGKIYTDKTIMVAIMIVMSIKMKFQCLGMEICWSKTL